jgi:prophage tail gpP-like protein
MAEQSDDLQLGGFNDTIELRLGGDIIRIVEDYEVKVSILQQPAAFTLRLGWSATAAEILKKYPPGTPFELWCGPVCLQSGLVYSRGQPSAQYTQVEIKGRDYLAVLFDDDVQAEYTFTEKTYYALTRKILNVVGLKEDLGDGQGGRTRFVLYDSFDADRKLATNVKAKPRNGKQLIQQIETGATSGQGKLVYQTPKADIGVSWFQFLQEQYRPAGLFLWATGTGNFVLARPRADQEPAYHIYRARGQIREQGNIKDCKFQDDTTQRHAACIVYGRGGHGKNGRGQIQGYWVDDEMTGYGFQNVRVVNDHDVISKEQADYVARRFISEERRNGWQLEYTVAGHRKPNLAGTGLATWTPDSTVVVDDEELNIHGKFYIESVTYRRKPETTTTFTLMRPEDLQFADMLNESSSKKSSGSKPTPKTTKPAKSVAEVAEQFVRENFSTPAGPPDLLEGLRR